MKRYFIPMWEKIIPKKQFNGWVNVQMYLFHERKIMREIMDWMLSVIIYYAWAD